MTTRDGWVYHTPIRENSPMNLQTCQTTKLCNPHLKHIKGKAPNTALSSYPLPGGHITRSTGGAQAQLDLQAWQGKPLPNCRITCLPSKPRHCSEQVSCLFPQVPWVVPYLSTCSDYQLSAFALSASINPVVTVNLVLAMLQPIYHCVKRHVWLQYYWY